MPDVMTQSFCSFSIEFMMFPYKKETRELSPNPLKQQGFEPCQRVGLKKRYERKL
jgi:hypothetical protein